jgi:hypothetical protein
VSVVETWPSPGIGVNIGVVVVETRVESKSCRVSGACVCDSVDIIGVSVVETRSSRGIGVKIGVVVVETRS